MERFGTSIDADGASSRVIRFYETCSGTAGTILRDSTPQQYGETSDSQAPPTNGAAGGIGGGGGSSGRPVAIIIIEPDSVKVEPVVDVTKIALAALTVCGTMAMLLGRMRKASRGAMV
jgi:hypothetical protein